MNKHLAPPVLGKLLRPCECLSSLVFVDYRKEKYCENLLPFFTLDRIVAKTPIRYITWSRTSALGKIKKQMGLEKEFSNLAEVGNPFSETNTHGKKLSNISGHILVLDTPSENPKSRRKKCHFMKCGFS